MIPNATGAVAAVLVGVGGILAFLDRQEFSGTRPQSVIALSILGIAAKTLLYLFIFFVAVSKLPYEQLPPAIYLSAGLLAVIATEMLAKRFDVKPVDMGRSVVIAIISLVMWGVILSFGFRGDIAAGKKDQHEPWQVAGILAVLTFGVQIKEMRDERLGLKKPKKTLAEKWEGFKAYWENLQTESSRPAVAFHEQRPATNELCFNCAKPVVMNAAFCPHCGQPVKEQPPSQPPGREKSAGEGRPQQREPQGDHAFTGAYTATTSSSHSETESISAEEYAAALRLLGLPLDRDFTEAALEDCYQSQMNVCKFQGSTLLMNRLTAATKVIRKHNGW
jgi:hypothetical protein